MTMQQSTQWQTKDNRKGVFGDYTVMAFKFENRDGELGWHITAWPEGLTRSTITGSREATTRLLPDRRQTLPYKI